ncbi:MAG: membrane protein insertion efficiency factor YidD [Oligoflexia bacterium]|nr:membrane protein insertion efficiency factor YidD [Oligoflexia bacterium]
MSLGVQCRFNPSCSHYFVDAVKMHGIFKGSFLGICRLLRCHPLCKGGDDFVPEKLELCRK